MHPWINDVNDGTIIYIMPFHLSYITLNEGHIVKLDTLREEEPSLVA